MLPPQIVRCRTGLPAAAEPALAAVLLTDPSLSLARNREEGD
jgi:hypothetical protein